MFTRFIVILYVYLVGVRFYKIPDDFLTRKYRDVVCITHDGKKITFTFYNATHTLYIYKRDKAVRINRKALIVKAAYDEDFPEEIKRFNELVFYFTGLFARLYRSKIINEIMILAYLDVVKSHGFDALKDSIN